MLAQTPRCLPGQECDDHHHEGGGDRGGGDDQEDWDEDTDRNGRHAPRSRKIGDLPPAAI